VDDETGRGSRRIPEPWKNETIAASAAVLEFPFGIRIRKKGAAENAKPKKPSPIGGRLWKSDSGMLTA
jgi:hypothetical protein